MTTYSQIGQRIGRVEGPDKVRGWARYTADVARPGMLWGKCLRSPFPHARIIAIDYSRAQALPGVRDVVTYREAGTVPFGRWHPVRWRCEFTRTSQRENSFRQ